MAILVRINKIRTSNGKVTYSFIRENGEAGTFLVDSQTGSLELLSSMPHDSKKLYFARAARKVMTEWKSNGFLPEKTFWAS